MTRIIWHLSFGGDISQESDCGFAFFLASEPSERKIFCGGFLSTIFLNKSKMSHSHNQRQDEEEEEEVALGTRGGEDNNIVLPPPKHAPRIFYRFFNR